MMQTQKPILGDKFDLSFKNQLVDLLMRNYTDIFQILGGDQTYTVSNVTADRTYDANATNLDEIADVLGTLLADLRAKGLIL